MKTFYLKLAQKLDKIKFIAEKSVFLMLILALVWQCFPRVTSLAQTIEPRDSATIQTDNSQDQLSRQERIIMILNEIARQENYDNPELVIAIAKAESRLNPDIRGESDNRDRGLFQINSYFNADVTDECAFDPVCSTKWVIGELKAGHAWKWNASRYKWGKYAYND